MGEFAIRSFCETDVKSLAKHANNVNIWKNLRNAFPYPFTEEDAQSWIDRAMNKRNNSDFAITHQHEVIGEIGFNPQNDIFAKSAEIGYWVSEQYWGKSIATNAVKEIVNYTFNHFDIVRIFTGVFSNNQSSVRVLEKNGFVFEGCLRKSVFKNEQLIDQLMYSLLKEEWLNNK